MNQDYIQITVAKDEESLRKLDLLLDLGEILSLEVRTKELIVLDLWENREKLLNLLQEQLPETEWTESRLEGRDWNQEWIQGFQPIRVNRKVWITPPWHEEKVPDDHMKIIINPGNAFGTGTHESTYLAMKLMQKMLCPGDTVLDMGCGSGILSIAAKKLGASRVHAIDNDPDISGNLQENLDRNDVPDISYEIGDILALETFECDLALINIQKHVILPLLKRFKFAKGIPNRLILAGLLKVHQRDIRNALKEEGYKILKIRRKKEWIAVSAVRRSENET